MIALARARLGSRAKMVCADLAQPLPFPDCSFDMVLSSLTLHYLEDWQPTLREFARVLRAGGRLLISTHHPFLTLDAVASYHDVAPIEEMWSGFGDDPVPVRFYHRPFARMVDDLATTGFRLTALREPQPSVEAEARDPALAQQLPRTMQRSENSSYTSWTAAAFAVTRRPTDPPRCGSHAPELRSWSSIWVCLQSTAVTSFARCAAKAAICRSSSLPRAPTKSIE